MNSNIMLGRKELTSILVILVCATAYFFYEYLENQKKVKKTIENFQGNQMDAKRLDEQRDLNMEIFSKYKNFVSNEKELFRNDIDIANYFIKKKFNLDLILRKPRVINGVREYIDKNRMIQYIKDNAITSDVDLVFVIPYSSIFHLPSFLTFSVL